MQVWYYKWKYATWIPICQIKKSLCVQFLTSLPDPIVALMSNGVSQGSTDEIEITSGQWLKTERALFECGVGCTKRPSQAISYMGAYI